METRPAHGLDVGQLALRSRRKKSAARFAPAPKPSILGRFLAEMLEKWIDSRLRLDQRRDSALQRAAALYRPRETIAMARKSKHEDELGSRAVEFAMANWDMQCTQSYVERGRQFENATAEELQTLFVQVFRDWRANLWEDGRRSRVADISAEYTLRGVDPPYALVEDDLLEIGSTVAADVALLDAPKSRH
jgi:hypothetical protein